LEHRDKGGEIHRDSHHLSSWNNGRSVMRTINLIVIHCSATRSNRRFTVDMLRDCHNARFHGKGIGYHYYIERDGQIHQTRPEEEIGMHALHYNAHSIGICYEGGLNEKGESDDTRTEEQKHALIALLKELRKDYPDARIMGHCELPGVTKPCPCFSCQEYRDYFEHVT
jgi:N-acetyl-anhydromuramyl-L-alanine amidase AmpD